MFGNPARIMVSADTADNCHIISRQEFASDPMAAFLLPIETPYIIMRSMVSTHIFTDVAYISCVGAATNPRRAVRRMEYAKFDIDSVGFETCGGMMDNDCTISFRVSGTVISIDVFRDHQPLAIRAYQCLVALCRQQQKNLRYLNFTSKLQGIQIALPPGSDPAVATTAALAGWVNYSIQSYDPENYSVIFQQYFP